MSDVLHRTRLFRCLDDARRSPIIWIAGPPGIGKTTLVVSYLHARKIRPLWYQVDERDADIATLFHYLSVACQRVAPRYRQPLPNLTPEYLLGLPVFTRRFFEALYGRLHTPMVIVFDNYQQVPVSSQFHEIMATGLAEIPMGLSVIILSRTAPPPLFARLQAARTIEVLDEKELRLTEKESAAIVHLVMKARRGKLSAAHIAQLYHRTDGWVSGLVLLLAQRKSGTSAHESELYDPPEVLFDYLAKEVMKGLEPEVQEFLLKTAVFSSMTATMAERLTGMASAEHIFTDLVKARLFIEERRHQERVYQFHSLFRDCLLFLAQTVYSSKQLADIQTTAAQVLEEIGRHEEAIELCQMARQLEGEVRLILKAAPAFLEQGRGKTIEEWIHHLPQAILDQNPWLLFWLGSARFPFNPPEAQRCFERAFPMFQTQQDRAGTLLTWSGIIGAIVHSWQDLRQLDRWIDLIPTIFPPESTGVPPDIEARMVCSIFTALVWRRLHAPLIKPWAERVRAVLRTSTDVSYLAQTSSDLSNYYTWMGDLVECSNSIDAVKQILDSKPLPPFAQVNLLLAEIFYAWHTGDLERAYQRVLEGQRIAQDSGVAILNGPLLIMQIYVLLSRGDHAMAEQKLGDMPLQMLGSQHFLIALHAYQSGWAAMLKEDIRGALMHANKALHMAQRVGSPFFEALCWFAAAQVLHECGNHNEAARHLDTAKVLCHGIRSNLLEFMVRFTEAKLAFEEGKESEGLAHLNRAFTLGREHNLVEMPWWRPRVMAELCVKALEAGIERDYVHRLVRTRHLVPDPPPVLMQAWPWVVTITTLGKFRLTVDDEPVVFAGKVQRRPLALLKVLIAFGGKGVGENQITDALWPEAEGDMGHQACATTLHRLRRLLRHEQVVQLKQGKVSLHPSMTWVDAWSFERLLTAATNPVKDKVSVTALCEQAFALYQGSFLAEEAEEPWAMAARDRLRRHYIGLVRRLAHLREHQENPERAISLLQQALRVEPLVEEFYQLLMSRLHETGQRAEARSVYDQCRAVLTAAHQGEPSPETESIHRRLLS
jgi:ATP/maltotriose-dependent transcriptional regulator MalT/DNA-binding SARP family transcriptional activator